MTTPTIDSGTLRARTASAATPQPGCRSRPRPEPTIGPLRRHLLWEGSPGLGPVTEDQGILDAVLDSVLSVVVRAVARARGCRVVARPPDGRGSPAGACGVESALADPRRQVLGPPYPRAAPPGATDHGQR